MRASLVSLVSLAFALSQAAACGSAATMTAEPATPDAPRPQDVVGITDRRAIEAEHPRWAEAALAANPMEDTARLLADVAPGAEIDVFLGTWCGDSRREVTRLFRALESVPEPYPFSLRFVGVDRTKQAGALTEGANVRYVPTIVVRREGVEVGRIVESAPRGIELELLDLLRGTTHGIISLRTDL